MTIVLPHHHIELVYEKSCPNVQQARDVIVRACQVAGVQLPCQEWDVADNNAPERIRHYGSPTILVNGKDVSASTGNDCACCRIYPENTEFKGCPALDDVVRALLELK